MILKIRNWEKFQHYKDRCPPWIKLHYTMLSSKDWVMFNDSERVLAIACMLIASQSQRGSGVFDADPEYIKRVAYLDRTPNLKPLIDQGFLEVVQSDASTCKQKQAKATTETETETETDVKPKPKRFQPPSVDDVRAYCRERNNAVDPERFIDHYTSNGWMVGRNKMKDWKASVRTWEKTDKKTQPIADPADRWLT